jgi:probable HAF family extracellular repeat protein
MLDLGTLGGASSRAESINDLGQIVGSAQLSGGTKNHAFLCADEKRNDLGALDGGDSAAIRINKHGHIVGTNGTWSFLYEAGTMIDLMTLLPRETGWKSLNVRCINDTG